MAIFKNTTDPGNSTFTDINLYDTYDHTLSNISHAQFFQTSSNLEISVNLNSLITFDGWNYGLNTDEDNINNEKVSSTFRVFGDVPNGSITQTDPGNNFNNVVGSYILLTSDGQGIQESGTEILDKGYRADRNGLFTFEIDQRGYSSHTDKTEKRGGLLSYQLVKYDSSSISGRLSRRGPKFPAPEIIYETDAVPLIYSSSQYNFALAVENSSSKYHYNYRDISAFGINYGGALLPFNTTIQNNANLHGITTTDISGEFDSISSTSGGNKSVHQALTIPEAGTYTFKTRLTGSATVETKVSSPPNYTGTFTTSDKTVQAQLIVKVRPEGGGSLVTKYTSDPYQITVTGKTFTDNTGGSTQQQFEDTSNFDLSVFNETCDIKLDGGESVHAYIKIVNPNGYGGQAYLETLDSTSGFLTEIKPTGFRIDDSSTFKLTKYIQDVNLGNKGIIHYNIKDSKIEIPLVKGDYVALRGHIRGVEQPESTSSLEPFNVRPDSQTRGLFIETIHASAHSFLKVTQGLFDVSGNTRFSHGENESRIFIQGNDLYQPVEGSFMVDLSDVKASLSHPVLVRVPLHGYTKNTKLTIGNVSENPNHPNNRKFLNQSVEINLSTVSNKDLSGSFYFSGQTSPTNQVIEANFMHWGRDNTAVTHHSATIARYDGFGNGYTQENIVSQNPFLSSDNQIFIQDDISSNWGASNGILQNDWVEYLSPNAMIEPQVVMIPGAFTSTVTGQDPVYGFQTSGQLISPLNPVIEGELWGEVLVSPSAHAHPSGQEFFQSIDTRELDFNDGSVPEYPSIPGSNSWYKMYNFIGDIGLSGMLNLNSGEFTNQYYENGYAPEDYNVWPNSPVDMSHGGVRQALNIESAVNLNNYYMSRSIHPEIGSPYRQYSNHDENNIPGVAGNYWISESYNTEIAIVDGVISPSFVPGNHLYEVIPTSMPIYFGNQIPLYNYGGGSSLDNPWHKDPMDPSHPSFEYLSHSAVYGADGTNHPNPQEYSNLTNFINKHGGLKGASKHPWVYNYYEAPKTGIYTIAYNLNVIVEAAGGYGSVGEGNGFTNNFSRYLHWTPETYDDQPFITIPGVGGLSGEQYNRTAPTTWNVYYDGSNGGGSPSALWDRERYSFASNTLYGRLVVTPTRYDEGDGNIPGNPRTISTSSLFRVDDYAGCQYFPQWMNLWGVNVGYSLFYWNTNDKKPRISNITIGYVREIDEAIINAYVVGQAQILAESETYGSEDSTNIIEEFTFPGNDITTNGFEDDNGNTFEDAVEGGFENEWFTNVGYPVYSKSYNSLGTIALNSYCDEIYFVGTTNPVESWQFELDGEPGPYTDPTGYNSGYDFVNIGGSYYEDENGNRVFLDPPEPDANGNIDYPNAIAVNENMWTEGPDGVVQTSWPMEDTTGWAVVNSAAFKSFINDIYDSGDTELIQSLSSWFAGNSYGLYHLGQMFENGIFPQNLEGYSVNGDFQESNLSPLEPIPPGPIPNTSFEQPGLQYNDGGYAQIGENPGFNEATWALINQSWHIAQTTFQEDSLAMSVTITFSGGDQDAAPSFESFDFPFQPLSAGQTEPAKFLPERVMMPVSDKTNVFLKKGDRLHLEVGIGPILPAGCYKWSDLYDKQKWNPTKQMLIDAGKLDENGQFMYTYKDPNNNATFSDMVVSGVGTRTQALAAGQAALDKWNYNAERGNYDKVRTSWAPNPSPHPVSYQGSQVGLLNIIYPNPTGSQYAHNPPSASHTVGQITVSPESIFSISPVKENLELFPHLQFMVTEQKTDTVVKGTYKFF